jgi:transposase-like protein
MSTKNKKASATGVRYSDAQKQEVVDFVAQYNSANGRGGQSAAAAKFKVTPLTISAWIKKLGAPKAKKAVKAAPAAKAVKAAAPVKAAKPAKAVKAGKSKKGVRYNAEQKQEVVDYVASYNAANGRGGQSHAAAKFGLSVLTVATWLKNAGTSAKGTKAKAVVVKAVKAVKAAAPVAVAAVPSGLAAKVASFIAVGEQVRKAEVELQSLRAKLDSLKSSIQASL